jgi:tryptophan-rich sensory protein
LENTNVGHLAVWSSSLVSGVRVVLGGVGSLFIVSRGGISEEPHFFPFTWACVLIIVVLNLFMALASSIASKQGAKKKKNKNNGVWVNFG